MSEQKNRGYNNIGFIRATPERSIFFDPGATQMQKSYPKKNQAICVCEISWMFFLQRVIAISRLKIVICRDTFHLQRHLLSFWILRLQKDRKWRNFSGLMPWFQDLYLSTDFSLATETQGTHCPHWSSVSWVVHSSCAVLCGMGAPIAPISANGSEACRSVPLWLKDCLRVQIFPFLCVPLIFASM